MSNSKKFYHYRIIYSPLPEIFDEGHVDFFVNLLKKETRYAIAPEHGNKTNISHLDIYVELVKEIRKDKLTDKIKRMLKKHKIDIKKVITQLL